ncbi:Uncharacterized protein FWK35_00018049 [Aphis craccivora]|uniref:Uncharacterized protein n=1 Tax=Aphis craccivora TaxID=307492 RepID=A0A6G0YHL3_APHCR|nr:Uncharacterized protein FWK35_00018049 [Aphis craccivora]
MSVDLKSKLSNICLNYISLNHYDYFILTETWLTNDINSKELGIYVIINYIIYRNDRNNLNSIYSRGGGVLIAIHDRFYSFEITLPDPTLECVAIMIKLVNIKIIIISLYK